MRRVLIAILLIAMCGTASADEGWDHTVGIYGWFIGLKGTIGIADVAELPVDVTFDDLSSYLDFALEGHYEALGSTRTWVVDFSYANLGAERDAQILNQPVKVNPNLTQWIVEFGHGWRLSSEFTVFLAARYYNIDTGIAVTGEAKEKSGNVGKGWADGYLGGRWAKRLGTKWTLSLRGDIGTGGSQIALYGQALIGFDISEKFALAGGWRVLYLDHESDEGSDDYFKYDITQSGWGLALAYKF